MSDQLPSESVPTGEEQGPLCARGMYREVVLGNSLGYQGWELLEAVDCSGLNATLGYLRREADRRRRELN